MGWFTGITENDIQFTNITPVYSNITLYAHWENTTFEIHYDLDGGINHPDNPITFNSQNLQLTLLEPTKEGYNFEGWIDSSGLIFDGILGNQELYLKARWKSLSILKWVELDENLSMPLENIEITFFIQSLGRNEALLKNKIDEFQNLYPNVFVNIAQGNNYEIPMYLSAGQILDIALISDYVAYDLMKYYSNNILALNPFIRHPLMGVDDFDTDFSRYDFSNMYNYDSVGTISSFPLFLNHDVLYYDKDYFEQNNYEIPTTWDELFVITNDIKTREPNVVPLSLNSNSLFTMINRQNNLNLIRFDSNKFESLVLLDNQMAMKLKFHKDLLDNNLMGYHDKDFIDFNADDPVDRNYLLLSSNYLMNSSFSINDSIGVAKLPQVNANDNYQTMTSTDLVLFDNGNQNKMIASWYLLKYLTTTESYTDYAVGGYSLPLRDSVFNTTKWAVYEQKSLNEPVTNQEYILKLHYQKIMLFKDTDIDVPENTLLTSFIDKLSQNLLWALFDYVPRPTKDFYAFLDEQIDEYSWLSNDD